jgi:hypothetical protein
MVSLAAVFASCVNFSLNAIDDWSIYVATISVSTSSEETQLINFRSSTGLKLLLFRTNPHLAALLTLLHLDLPSLPFFW